jgi:hypothetical protein
MYQVSSGGLLNFSTAVPATYIVGLECDKQIQFTSCVINTWTGEAVCRTNYAGCGPCPQGPIE